MEINLFEAWQFWLDDITISEYTYYGISIKWWGRIGTIAQFAIGLSLVKSIGLKRLKNLGKYFKNVYSFKNFSYLAKFSWQFAIYFNYNSYLFVSNKDWNKLSEESQKSDKELKYSDNPEHKNREKVLKKYPVLGYIFLTILILAMFGFPSLAVYTFYNKEPWYMLILFFIAGAMMVEKYGSFVLGIFLFVISSFLLIFYSLILLPTAIILNKKYLGKIISIIGFIIGLIGFHFALLAS